MLAIAILAAGKGTRMKSPLPKVLQNLAGTSLIEHVLNNCRTLQAKRRFLIVGHQSELVKNKLTKLNELEYVLQEPQKGTGHAIQQLLSTMETYDGELLVLNGDVPLLKPQTIERLINTQRESGADATILTARLKNPTGYGRVFTSSKNCVKAIIEHRDCSKEQLSNTLTNAGVYCFSWKKLKSVLPKLTSNNDQEEIYLTDAISLLSLVMHLEVTNTEEVKGINNQIQLAECEAIIQQQLSNYWMQEGVKFIDPSSCTLSQECKFGENVTIEPQTHFRGSCFIGNGCNIGPGCLIKDSILGENVCSIYSVLDNAQVGNGVTIGPFANIRPGSEIENKCRIGNFVEIKNSHINTGSKINHLSYIGDAELGQKVNIGAGTITANYDGINKHKTIIGDNTKTGANSVLVAPISIGSNVTIGAGSTLTKNVPNNALSLERNKQLIREDWTKGLNK